MEEVQFLNHSTILGELLGSLRQADPGVEQFRGDFRPGAAGARDPDVSEDPSDLQPRGSEGGHLGEES